MTTDTLLYVAQSAAWAVGGFLGGYLAGRAARDVHQLASAVETGDTTVDPPPPPSRRRRPRAEWVLGVVVLLLAIVTVVQGLVQSAATRRVVQCQAEYGNAFADALDARTQASAGAQNALDQLVTTIGNTLNGPPSPARAAAVHQAIAEYLATRAKLKQQQQAHPYPPAPRDLCP
jgi:hypothetical protein